MNAADIAEEVRRIIRVDLPMQVVSDYVQDEYVSSSAAELRVTLWDDLHVFLAISIYDNRVSYHTGYQDREHLTIHHPYTSGRRGHIFLRGTRPEHAYAIATLIPSRFTEVLEGGYYEFLKEAIGNGYHEYVLQKFTANGFAEQWPSIEAALLKHLQHRLPLSEQFIRNQREVIDQIAATHGIENATKKLWRLHQSIAAAERLVG